MRNKLGLPQTKFAKLLHDLHGVSALELNKLDNVEGRKVWFNFWDTKLTILHSYLARLNYVHQNAAKHKLVPVANQFRGARRRGLSAWLRQRR